MYTNKEIANLLTWGIEGRDYVVKDGIAAYPDGVTASNVKYHTSDFLYGNQFLVYPWKGSPADLREQQKAALDAAGISKYLGFTCDTSSITNELTVLGNVISEYAPGLESGTTDNYNEFIKALKKAGVDKVVAEYQSQLDAWLADKK